MLRAYFKKNICKRMTPKFLQTMEGLVYEIVTGLKYIKMSNIHKRFIQNMSLGHALSICLDNLKKIKEKSIGKMQYHNVNKKGILS